MLSQLAGLPPRGELRLMADASINTERTSGFKAYQSRQATTYIDTFGRRALHPASPWTTLSLLGSFKEFDSQISPVFRSILLTIMDSNNPEHLLPFVFPSLCQESKGKVLART